MPNEVSDSTNRKEECPLVLLGELRESIEYWENEIISKGEKPTIAFQWLMELYLPEHWVPRMSRACDRLCQSKKGIGSDD